ncbi:MAG: ABC transporter permease [Acidimicrobiales bacterium]
MTRRYVLWRLVQLVPTCAGIVLVGFLLVHAAPGDPVLALAGESGDAAYYERIRERFGLDRSVLDQLVTYTGNVVRGDLGTSYTRGLPALEVVWTRLPATLLLTTCALVVSTFVGITLGVVAAARPHGIRDALIGASSLGLYATPAFLAGQLAVLIFALRLGWFPVQGMTTARSDATGLDHVLDVAHHLVLPVLVLAAAELAAVARLTRAGVLDELGRDHVTTARAKGASEARVLVRHALRRALLPVVTVIGGRIGHLVAGTVVVEAVFSWPGVGRLLISSVQARDTPIVLALFMLIALTVVVANLLTDLTYAWLDPRVRYR